MGFMPVHCYIETASEGLRPEGVAWFGHVRGAVGLNTIPFKKILTIQKISVVINKYKLI